MAGRVRSVERRREIPAPPAQVWARVSRMAGVNDEFWPWLRMTVPRSFRGGSLDGLPLGEVAGRSWLLLLGFIPFDYDDLLIAEREPGRRFRETSTMLSMSRWEHERTLEPRDGGAGTVVHDRLTFELRKPLARVPGLGAAVTSAVSALFAHRHRPLERAFRPAGPRGWPLGT